MSSYLEYHENKANCKIVNYLYQLRVPGTLLLAKNEYVRHPAASDLENKRLTETISCEILLVYYHTSKKSCKVFVVSYLRIETAVKEVK